jgi:hypothetical protein
MRCGRCLLVSTTPPNVALSGVGGVEHDWGEVKVWSRRPGWGAVRDCGESFDDETGEPGRVLVGQEKLRPGIVTTVTFGQSSSDRRS